MYLVNAIARFVEESDHVEKHKVVTSKKMMTLLINSNKAINEGNDDIIFKIG